MGALGTWANREWAGAMGEATDDVVVARRPVVDRTRQITGFELVYRPGPEEESRYAGAEHGVVAVHDLLRSHGTALDEVVGSGLAHCHVDRELLVSDSPLMLVPRRTVLRVPGLEVDDALVAGVAHRRREQYTLAFEGSARTEVSPRLLEIADLLALDVRDWSPSVVELAERCRAASVRLLALGCDSEAELAAAGAAGFDLFQGAAVQAPPAPSGATIAPSALTQLQLGLELLGSELEMERVELILRREPGLVVQVLHLASAGRSGGLRREVRSVREALVVMGTRRLQRWAALTVLGRHGRTDTDALLTGLVRGRTCELLAPARGVEPAFAFTAGLISTLDLLLGVDLDQLEDQLRIGPDLVAAAFRREGAVGALVTEVAAWQDAVQRGSTAVSQDATVAGANGFAWATSLVHTLSATG